METQVWSGRFWMGRFKSLSPKPHVMYSNDKEMILLLCRKAGYMSREEAQQCPVRTSKTYLDSRGQKRSVGRKKELRQSQSPAWIPIQFFSNGLYCRNFPFFFLNFRSALFPPFLGTFLRQKKGALFKPLSQYQISGPPEVLHPWVWTIRARDGAVSSWGFLGDSFRKIWMREYPNPRILKHSHMEKLSRAPSIPLKSYILLVYTKPLVVYMEYILRWFLVPFGLWNLTFTLIRNLFLALRIPQLWMQLWPTLSSSSPLYGFGGPMARGRSRPKPTGFRNRWFLIQTIIFMFHEGFGQKAGSLPT